MVPVRNIHGGNLSKDIRDALDGLLVVDHPERVPKTLGRRYEIVLRLTFAHLRYDRIEVIAVRVGEEHRLHVRVQRAHMFHPVFLFVLARQLVLLDAALQVVIHPCAYHQTILCLAVHRLRIDVVFLLLVLNEPTLELESLELLLGLCIAAGVMLIRARRKIDLRLDDVIQTHLIARGFLACFFAIEHVVRTATHLLHQLLRRTYSFKRFYFHEEKNVLCVFIVFFLLK